MFVHLRTHSEFSMVDGTLRMKDMVKRLKETNQPAIALTDQSNLFGMVRFYKTMLGAGIKPIIGVDAWLQRKPTEPPFRAVLIAQNRAGYLSLSRLISKSYQLGQTDGSRAVMQWDWLEGETDHLIALSGAQEGDIGQALQTSLFDIAERYVKDWVSLFGDRFYIELQRIGKAGEAEYIRQAVALASQYQVPVVATNYACFAQAEDFEAHEVRVCIHDGYLLNDHRRTQKHSPQQYLRSTEEMMALFSDIPEAIENTVEIAKRCSIEIELGKNYLPDFPVPEGMTLDEFFAAESEKGLRERIAFLFPEASGEELKSINEEYFSRLKFELDIIIEMGFPGYFMIVADFIQWAKDNQIPVGPGRGSGAGSLVAYALKITDLDPIKYALLFERFLNPERVSMPDFDIDFCMDRRDEVIDYVARKYGRNQVSQIITYGTMAAKAVVRDVGRVMGHPYGFVDKVSKMIPPDLGMTLSKALEESDDLKERYANDEEVTALIDMALKLEGLTRNAGKHAGGVVISPTDLTDFSPLYCEPDGTNLVTQYDKKDVEDVGLVKFDFLGLRTLTIIDWAVQSVNERNGAKLGDDNFLDIAFIDLDDKAVFEKILKPAETTSVFQLESRGMKEMIKKLQPDVFEDIIAMVALYRPGPLGSGMVDDFIARKHGRQEIAYPHPDLEEVLRETYGTILYQEQVMQIAQVLAKYTLGGADMLRRAMGKKIPEEMAKQREIFEKGASENGIDASLASKIFDTMEEFAKYGFNKSHSAAYALVSYQTAWMKYHYPASFMAAVMSADMDNTEKVVNLVYECEHMGMEVLPPDVNRCEYRFKPEGDETNVIYGLGAIKGVGEGAIESIVQARQNGGSFHSLFDFCLRVDLKKVNRRVLEKMIRAGAFDQIVPNRATALHNLNKALKNAEQQARNDALGQDDLFGGAAQPMDESVNEANYEVVKEMKKALILEAEKETLGLYLSGHPLDIYRKELDCISKHKISGLEKAKDKTITLTGIVSAVRTQMTKKGTRMAFLLLDDQSGLLEIAVFSEVFARVSPLLQPDAILIVEGPVRYDDYSGGFKMTAESVMTLTETRSEKAKRLEIRLPKDVSDEQINAVYQSLNQAPRGHLSVMFKVQTEYAQGAFNVDASQLLTVEDELIEILAEQLGESQVEMVY